MTGPAAGAAYADISADARVPLSGRCSGGIAVAKSIKRRTLQYRFLIFTLSISLILIVLTLGFAFFYFLRSMSDTTEQYMHTYMEYADDTLTARLDSATLLAHTVAADEKIIQQTIRRSSPEASYDWFQEQLSIRSYLNGMIVDKSYISRLALLLNSGNIYSSGDTLFWHSLDEEWFADDSGSLRIRNLPEQKAVLITRPILVRGQSMGQVLILLDTGELCSAFAIQPLEDAAIRVYASDGSRMYSSDSALSYSEDELGSSLAAGVYWQHWKPHFALRYENSATGITTVALIPGGRFLNDVFQWGRFILILVVLAVILALGATRIFGKALFRNLNILMDSMRAVRHGDLSRRAVVSSHDEISEAADSFNRTLAHIEKLTEDIRMQEEQKRLAEQRVLEAQIRPHFVYNSISAMQYAAQANGQEEIEHAAQALSALMRSVLGNHDALVTLWEEKNYIDSYIVLQRFKFKNQFQLVWDVDESLWMMTLPKLLLQPLVENALIHGIRFREEGVITVSAHQTGDGKVSLQVRDNGEGMTQEQIDTFTNQAEGNAASFRSVGLRNVTDRIRLYYQGEGSFRIVSEPGKYTLAEIVIPQTEQEGERNADTGSTG